MNTAMFSALIPLIALAACMFTHILIVRLARLSAVIRASIVAGFFICFLGSWGENVGDFVMNIASYFALAFCYWAVINLNRTALRIRVLKELYKAPGQRLNSDTLAQLYHPHEMFTRRIARLTDGGFAHEEHGRLRTGSRGLVIIAQILSVLRDVTIPQDKRP